MWGDLVDDGAHRFEMCFGLVTPQNIREGLYGQVAEPTRHKLSLDTTLTTRGFGRSLGLLTEVVQNRSSPVVLFT